jgi:hypothetical protein
MRTFGNYSQLGQQNQPFGGNSLGLANHPSNVWGQDGNPFAVNNHSPFQGTQNQNIPLDRGLSGIGSQRSFVGEKPPFYAGQDFGATNSNFDHMSSSQGYRYGLGANRGISPNNNASGFDRRLTGGNVGYQSRPYSAIPSQTNLNLPGQAPLTDIQKRLNFNQNSQSLYNQEYPQSSFG